jgi:hypothetical protein
LEAPARTGFARGLESFPLTPGHKRQTDCIPQLACLLCIYPPPQTFSPTHCSNSQSSDFPESVTTPSFCARLSPLSSSLPSTPAVRWYPERQPEVYPIARPLNWCLCRVSAKKCTFSLCNGTSWVIQMSNDFISSRS